MTALTSSSVQLHATIALPAGSATTSATYHFEYGTSTAYGSQTPALTANVPSTGLAVSTAVSGLQPYTTYHYRLVASDCGSAACQATSGDQTFTTGSTLQPAENANVGVTPIAGQIKVKLRGHRRFTVLPAGALIPDGATLDARHGTVLLVSAIGNGEVASGRFSSGIFTVTQPAGGGTTVLGLVSNFAACRPRASVKRAVLDLVAAAKRPRKASHKVVNQVFGNAHGQFTTRGHYATAADEGTGWRTADRCDGTLLTVSAGKVTITDFVHHRTFVLKAGHSYLAKHR